MFFLFPKIFLREIRVEREGMEESDGVFSTQTTTGSDTPEGTENTTVQVEEEKRDIRTMSFVTTSDVL